MIFRRKYQMFGLIAMFAMLCSVEAVMAQPGGRQRNPFGGTTGIGLLTQEAIQKELELVGDQIDDIKALQEEQRETMREVIADGRGGDRAEMMGKLRDMNKGYEAKASDILLPHQVKRLKQLMVQDQSRRGGGATSGSLPENIIEELGITDEQLEEMKKKAEEVTKEMNEKIAKIRAEAQDDVLSVLDKDQQSRYKEMVGKAFQFPARNRGGQFGGGRGQGGRGQGAGGRGGGRGQGGGGRGGRRPGGDSGGGERGADF